MDSCPTCAAKKRQHRKWFWSLLCGIVLLKSILDHFESKDTRKRAILHAAEVPISLQGGESAGVASLEQRRNEPTSGNNNFSTHTKTVNSISSLGLAVNEHLKKQQLQYTHLPSRHDNVSVSHCFFREYPRPTNVHLGLPFVGDVSASHDRKVVYVAVEGRMNCQTQYRKAHDWFESHNSDEQKSNNYTKHGQHHHPGAQFDCIFEGSNSTRVRSRPVHSMGNRQKGGFFALIECPVPEHMQNRLPAQGSSTTRAHLTLEALMDMETRQPFAPSAFKPQLTHLPICSHAWPVEPILEEEELHTRGRAGQRAAHNHRVHDAKTKRMISLMTRISTTYRRGSGSHEQLSLDRNDFVPWIEYHLALGIDHFYIYDDSPNPETSAIREWCQPYWEEGIVTYVHFPYNDVECDSKMMHGNDFYAGQVVASNVALRRYEKETVWMGHWDLDEWLVIPNVTNRTTLLSYVERHGNTLDNLVWMRPLYGTCGGGAKRNPHYMGLSPPLIPFATKQCRRGYEGLGKGLLRTSTVLSFRVHNANLRMDRTLPRRKVTPLYPRSNGHLAHFRRGQAGVGQFPIPTHHIWEDNQEWMESIERTIAARLQQLDERKAIRSAQHL